MPTRSSALKLHSEAQAELQTSVSFYRERDCATRRSLVPGESLSCSKMSSPKRILLFALFAAFLLAALGSLVLRPRDPLFHAKPQSAWMAGLTYGTSLHADEYQEQRRQWRAVCRDE